MKTRHMFIAVAAFTTLAACTKEFTEQQGSENSLKISVTATAENFANVADSKTHIDETNTIIWDENEQMTIFLVNNGTAEDATSNDFIDAGDTEAMFSFSFSSVPETGPYTYGGIYPSSADKGLAISNGSNTTNDKVELPAIQSATATSYDPAAYIMVAKPETFDEIQTTWIASYRRATALNKMTLTHVGEDIKSVEITVPEGKYLAGRRYIDIATGESGEIYYGGTNKVTVNYVSTALPHTAADVWFTSWEVQVAEGENVTVKVTTGSKIYTKTISARAEGIKFLENYLNTITIDMSDAEIEEIEETPGIQEGEYLIAAFNGSNWAIMTSTLNRKYFDPEQTSVTKSDVTCADFYGIQDIDSHVWNISTFENGYSIQSAATSKYFDIAGEKEVAYSDTPVTLNILDNGDGTVSISGSNSSFGYLRYNSGSPRFTTYKSGQTPVALIPWTDPTFPVILVQENSKTVSANETSVTFEYSTINIDGEISAVESSDEDDIISVVSATNGTVTVSLNPNTEERPKNATITLSYPGAEDVDLIIEQRAYVQTGVELTAVFDYSIIDTPSSTVDNISINASQGSGSSSPAYNKNSKELRIYRANEFTISGIGNAIISSIVFELSSSYGGNSNFNSTPEGYDRSSTSWTGESNSVTFKNGTTSDATTQFRIKKITVTYSFPN